MKATYPLATTKAGVAALLPHTPERFSRVLGQANPSVRSSIARIVPMATPAKIHHDDVIVGAVCVFALIALIVFACLGWLS